MQPGTLSESGQAELARLRLENAELRAGIDARAQENAVLLQMVSDVISTLTLDQALRHIVEHLVAAVGCHGAFIYLWDDARQRLVLRAASDRYQHHIGRISMRLGEGLAGWSAATREPVMLGERALDDPRFRYFPELEEELFQAILTVPMTGSDGSVVAVINMHTIAPQEFTQEHVRLVGGVAALLGGAIETSELYENTMRKLTVLSALSGSVRTVRAGAYLDEALHALAETTVRVTSSDVCVLILAEPGLGRLSVRAYRREERAAEAAPEAEEVAEATAMVTLCLGNMEPRPWDSFTAGVPLAALGLAVPGGPTAPVRLELEGLTAEMNAPLVAAGEQLGLMLCYRGAARSYAAADEALLNIVANQVAIAIKNSQLADLLAERDVPARLFRDLEQGADDGDALVWRRAALLGCDLTRPHVPLVLAAVTDATAGNDRPGNGRKAAYEAAAAALRRWLAGAHMGSVAHADAPTQLLALVRLPLLEDEGNTLPDQLDATLSAIEQETGLCLAGGMGRVCRAPHAYRRGFAEAREALRVTRALPRRASGAVAHFDRLGALRYLSRLPVNAAADAPDRYQEGLDRVAAYDARKRMALLETLETYLACGGTIARASQRLYVHRNTLVQRLEKLRELLELDPHDSDHWLALHVALTLRRFQQNPEQG